jgi:hypothetical protein
MKSFFRENFVIQSYKTYHIHVTKKEIQKKKKPTLKLQSIHEPNDERDKCGCSKKNKE